jgi:hypothetical protein
LPRLLRHRVQLLALALVLLLRGNAALLLQPLLLLAPPLGLLVAAALLLLLPLLHPLAAPLLFPLLLAVRQSPRPLLPQGGFELLELLVEDVAPFAEKVLEVFLLLLLHTAEPISMFDVALALFPLLLDPLLLLLLPHLTKSHS